MSRLPIRRGRRHRARGARGARRCRDRGADDGAGFAPGIADRAYERFARGDEARTRGGAGLGLAIVRAIAESHGGRAEIVTDSRARIWLPSQAHFSAVAQPASVPTSEEAT